MTSWLEKVFDRFGILKFSNDLFQVIISRQIYHVHLKRMCILLLLDGMSCVCLFSLAGLMCCLGPVFPYWFSV